MLITTTLSTTAEIIVTDLYLRSDASAAASNRLSKGPATGTRGNQQQAEGSKAAFQGSPANHSGHSKEF